MGCWMRAKSQEAAGDSQRYHRRMLNLDERFHLAERGSDLRTELRAGLATLPVTSGDLLDAAPVLALLDWRRAPMEYTLTAPP